MLRNIFVSLALAAVALASTAASAQEKWVRLDNRSTFWIAYVYITPAGTSSWGSDVLGNDSILPGNSRKWNIPWETCSIDLKAVSMMGFNVERRNVNICGGGVWTLHDE